MSLDDFGKLWIASSDLTTNVANIRRAFNFGADTVVLKTAVRNPPKKGKNYVLKDQIIVYYDFSRYPQLEQLLTLVPPFLEDARDGKFLEGFSKRPDPGSVTSYSHNGDARLLTIEQANELYEQIKREFPDRNVVQSLGIEREEDFKLIDRLRGDGVEINLRYFHKAQRTPILIPMNGDLMHVLGLEDEVRAYNANRDEVLAMVSRYAEQRGPSTRPILLKLQRQTIEMDYRSFYQLDFDGFTGFDSCRNIIANYDEIFGFFLINKGKTSGANLFRSTSEQIGILRGIDDTRYVSASGGIMLPEQGLRLLSESTNSVQLCSAIYFNGFGIVEEFADVLK